MFTAVSNAWQAFSSGDFAGVAKSFDGLGKKIGDAFDMKKITAMKNANIEVREQEKAVRSAMKAAAEADKEKQKNADNDNKRANAASNARKREQEEIKGNRKKKSKR